MVQAVRVCVEQQEDYARRAVSRVGGGGRVPFLSGGCNQPFRFSSANGITAALFFPDAVHGVRNVVFRCLKLRSSTNILML